LSAASDKLLALSGLLLWREEQAKARIAELERVIGRQQVDLDDRFQETDP
jgi:hypothetical protein